MRHTIILLIFVICAISFCTQQAQAVPITIEISGEVTSASGSGLPSSIYEGVTFTGTYTYKSSTEISGDGHHLHDSPYGITLSLGGYEFKTTPSHVGQFDMWIMDDLLLNGVKDYYLVRSHENISVPSLGLTVGSIIWDLIDNTHMALSSDDLPLTAPVLTEWDYNYFEIYGFDDLGGLLIKGTVTQAIPEPLTGVLMTMGIFFLRRRK
jgi:hypothetical protein